jgi:hypothetical protein
MVILIRNFNRAPGGLESHKEIFVKDAGDGKPVAAGHDPAGERAPLPGTSIHKVLSRTLPGACLETVKGVADDAGRITGPPGGIAHALVHESLFQLLTGDTVCKIAFPLQAGDEEGAAANGSFPRRIVVDDDCDLLSPVFLKYFSWESYPLHSIVFSSACFQIMQDVYFWS